MILLHQCQIMANLIGLPEKSSHMQIPWICKQDFNFVPFIHIILYFVSGITTLMSLFLCYHKVNWIPPTLSPSSVLASALNCLVNLSNKSIFHSSITPSTPTMSPTCPITLTNNNSLLFYFNFISDLLLVFLII